jgi:tetratricopeptide (TPR) repeat protein
VELFERGLGALQAQEYDKAARIFRAVVDQFPEEKELLERVRLYLNVCSRQTVPLDSTPRNLGEKVYAATLAINAANFVEAVRLLREVEQKDSGHEHAQYMLAVAYTQLGDTARATRHLRKAVDLNPENRVLARRDPDLEALRQDEAARAFIFSPAARRDRHGPSRAGSR